MKENSAMPVGTGSVFEPQLGKWQGSNTTPIAQIDKYDSVNAEGQIPVPLKPVLPEAIAGSRNNNTLVYPIALVNGTVPVTALVDRWHLTRDDDTAFVVVTNPGADINDGVLFTNPIVVGENDGQPLKCEFVLSELYVANGEDRFFDLYVIQGSDIGDLYVSEPLPFEIDLRRPGGDRLVPVQYDDALASGGMTLADLEEAGGFPATVPAYNDQQKGDVLTLFILPAGATEPLAFPAGTLTSDNTGTEIRVPVDFFLDNGIDGSVEIWLESRDIAGNVGESRHRFLDTLIANQPEDFGPIAIPLHDNDNLINEQDARQDPAFTIPLYTKVLVGDFVRVKIDVGSNDDGSENGRFLDIPVLDAAQDPIAKGMLYYALLDEIRKSRTTPIEREGLFSFNMNYWILRKRNNSTEGSFVVPSKRLKVVNVDMRLPGGPDPDPGTSIDENLKAPDVYGASVPSGGELPANANIILPGDSTKPARGLISRMNAAGNAQVFLTNDSIQLYRVDSDGSNRRPIGPALSITDPNVDLTNYVVPTGTLVNGLNFVQYSISRTYTDNGNTNIAWSPIQRVTVRSSSEIPGGGEPIKFTRLAFRDAVQRQRTDGSMRQTNMTYTRAFGVPPNAVAGVLIRVPHYVNMTAGDTVTLTLHGFNQRGGAGVIGSANVVKTYTVKVQQSDVSGLDSSGNPRPTAIPEDRLNDTGLGWQKVPGDDGHTSFVDIVIPYADIQEIKTPVSGGGAPTPAYGSAKITFTVTNAGGDSGESDPANSNEFFLDIDARSPTT